MQSFQPLAQRQEFFQFGGRSVADVIVIIGQSLAKDEFITRVVTIILHFILAIMVLAISKTPCGTYSAHSIP